MIRSMIIRLYLNAEKFKRRSMMKKKKIEREEMKKKKKKKLMRGRKKKKIKNKAIIKVTEFQILRKNKKPA